MKLKMLLLVGFAASFMVACTSSEYSQTKVIDEGAGAGTTWTPDPNAPENVETKVEVEEDKTFIKP